MSIQRRALPPFVATVLLSTAVGAVLVINMQVAFLVVLAAVGVAALATPAAAWVSAAVVATLTFRGFVQLGLLPSVATFADIGFAWGALAVAAMRRRNVGIAEPVLRRLALLAAATVASWVLHRSEILRPFLYFGLLGQPFALLAALMLDPPSPRFRRLLTRTLALLIALQVPIAFAQAAGHLVSGRGDPVQGTLYGAGAGTDTMSAIVAVGALWLLAATMGVKSWWRLPVAALSFAVPLLADAKQVVLALPAGVLAVSPRRPRIFVLQVFAVALSVFAMFKFAPAGAPNYLRQAEHGRGGKQATVTFVWKHLEGDPGSLLFGLGPAETVSRAAFMTTPLFLGPHSPLQVLGLQPATLAVEAQNNALGASGGGTSFNSGVSSALGVFGDLGIGGLLAYLALPIWIILRLRRSDQTVATPAAAGWGMLVVLGFVFDWWEQPPFAIVLAVLTGLALTASPTKRPAAAQPNSEPFRHA